MLSEIKKELLQHPDIISEILHEFGFSNISIHNSYISFGRDEEGSPKSIVIKLNNNDKLYVFDNPRNLKKDFIQYIIDEKTITYQLVIQTIKNYLHIENFNTHYEDKTIFGGLYEKIRKCNTYEVKNLDESVLAQFQRIPNLRFLRDGISLQSQKYFNICYDVESQGIVIPIYDRYGQLMGIKIRLNEDVDDGELKYFYLYPCNMSETLYGYSQNYRYLCNNTIFVLESEKAIMQAYDMGYRNCVSLGSSSISYKQIEMLLSVDPERIVFLHDQGLKLETIYRNINIFSKYIRMQELHIGYWDYTLDPNLEAKVSLTDLGKARFEYGINHEIKMVI